MNKRLEGLLEFYKKDPNDPFTVYVLALEYTSERQFDNAEKYFKILLDNHPDYVPGYLQFAQMKEKQDKIEEAKELYSRGIEAANKAGDKKSAKEMEDFLSDLE
jgi:tetratricopeptide (TPR) repeat protein